MKPYFSLATAFFLSFVFEPQISEAKNLKIISSINPIYQISKFITKENAENYLLSSSNISEHYQNLKPSDIKNIEHADLIFFISSDLEKNLAKVIDNTKNSLKKTTVIELINSSKRLKIIDSNFTQSKQDPHIWLDPDNAMIIAELIANKASEISPENSSFFKERLKQFAKQLETNKAEIKSQLATTKKFNYLNYYDEYKYFENYYQLKPTAIILNYHNQILSISNIKQINNLGKNYQIKCILTETKENSEAIKQVALENKIKIINTDILGNQIKKEETTENGYIAIIKNLADDFVKCSQ